VSSHLSSRFLEQLSDTIVFPLWATLMLAAALPIPQQVRRTIGCRPTLRTCGAFAAPRPIPSRPLPGLHGLCCRL